MVIALIDKNKVRKSIEDILQKEDVAVWVHAPTSKLGSTSYFGIFNPAREFHLFLGKLGNLDDRKQVEFIFQEADLDVKTAFNFYHSLQQRGQETWGILRRFGAWFDKKMYEHAMNGIYAWLQDTDSPFHELRNRLAVQSLQFLGSAGIPIDPYVPEQLRQAS